MERSKSCKILFILIFSHKVLCTETQTDINLISVNQSITTKEIQEDAKNASPVTKDYKIYEHRTTSTQLNITTEKVIVNEATSNHEDTDVYSNQKTTDVNTPDTEDYNDYDDYEYEDSSEIVDFIEIVDPNEANSFQKATNVHSSDDPNIYFIPPDSNYKYMVVPTDVEVADLLNMMEPSLGNLSQPQIILFDDIINLPNKFEALLTETQTDVTLISNQTVTTKEPQENNTTDAVSDTKENKNRIPRMTTAQLNTATEKGDLSDQETTDIFNLNAEEDFNKTMLGFAGMVPTNESNFKYIMASTDTEVFDLLNVTEPPPEETYTVNTRIMLFDDFINVGDKNMKGENTAHADLEHVDLVPGKLAAILAGVFLGISIIGYISLLSWRRYLENRYGNREMLVDDDYCEKQMNDLEHFSI